MTSSPARARRTVHLLLASVVALTAFGFAAPGTGAGTQPRGTLEVVKVVEGDAPAGTFVIEVTCDNEGTITLDFDGPGTEMLDLIADDQDCEVVETDDLGAISVTYDCQDVVPPSNPQLEGCQPVGPGGNFFQMQDSEQIVRITVTNTFDDAPTTTTLATTTIAPGVAPAAVARTATPTFTG
jgi:hypothetical protein